MEEDRNISKFAGGLRMGPLWENYLQRRHWKGEGH